MVVKKNKSVNTCMAKIYESCQELIKRSEDVSAGWYELCLWCVRWSKSGHGCLGTTRCSADETQLCASCLGAKWTHR